MKCSKIEECSQVHPIILVSQLGTGTTRVQPSVPCNYRSIILNTILQASRGRKNMTPQPGHADVRYEVDMAPEHLSM